MTFQPPDPRLPEPEFNRLAYSHEILTQRRLTDELEAIVTIGVELATTYAAEYANYLRGTPARNGKPARLGTPANKLRSDRVANAEDNSFTLARALGAALAVTYPPPPGIDPTTIAAKLIEHRTGPLCNGWRHNGETEHHPEEHCPVHPS